MTENGEKNREAEEKLMRCEKEREEYLNGWKRAQADFINYKNDESKRLEELLKFGQENILMEIISIADSVNLAISSLEKTGGVDRGIYMIKAQIDNFLKRHGIEKISAKQGDAFNPALHEAITAIEATNKPSNTITIIEEIENGYILHGKVVKPAKVKVNK